MQTLEIQPGVPPPEILENLEIYSSPFPRYVASSSTTWDLAVGAALNPGNSGERHLYVHDVVEHYLGAGHPTAPLSGRFYNVVVGNVGWNGTVRRNGHGAYIQNYGSLGQKLIEACMFVPGGMATAFKVYSETGETTNKTSNVIIRDTIALGWTIFQSTRQGLEDLVIENCVFVGDVRLGYGTRSRRVVFRNNIIFGNLDIAVGDDMVIENNAIVVYGPYRPDGMTYGAGNYGISPGGDAAYTNLSMSGNVIYTDRPQVAWNGWSRTQAVFYGVALRDTVTRPLADFGPLVKRIPVYEDPDAAERVLREENVFIYNPQGEATIALDGWHMVRDVRRWHSAAIATEVTMSGEPDRPLYWNDADGTPTVESDRFPKYGFFKIRAATQEEIIMTLEQQLQALITQLNALLPQITSLESQNTSLSGQVTALTDQLAAVTVERDEAVAFRTEAEPLVLAAQTATDELAALFTVAG